MPLPRDAQRWDYALDPQDQIDFGVDVSALLEPGDVLLAGDLSFQLSAEAEALGLRLVNDEGRAPAVASDGRTIVFWLAIDAARRADPSWDGWGRELPISISWSAGEPEARSFERTFVITVRDR